MRKIVLVNGKYLAFEGGWNEISICNTQTGNSMEIREENTYETGQKHRHGLKVIKWLNNEELKYEDVESYKEFQSIANSRTEKVFNIKTMKGFP